jgi:GT2 family glycosyltransferase
MSLYASIFGISGFFANQEGIGEVLESGFITSNFEQHSDITKVQWLSGCNQAYSKEAIEKVGSFDPGYVGHAYYEDADMSYRVYKSGYDLYAVSDAVVDHQVTPISREKLSRIKFFQLIHVNRFFLKNVYEGNKTRYLKHLIAHWALLLPVLSYSIIGRDPGLLWNYLKAERLVLQRVFTGID